MERPTRTMPTLVTERPQPHGRSIGAILVDAMRLTPLDAERIYNAACETGIRFGEAGVRLGLLTDADVQFALARQYEYPYLIRGDDNPLSDELSAAFMPFSPQVEALRGLRSQLQLRWFDSDLGGRALSVVSPQRGDGRSHLAANLAIVFSQLGERTLLIDADMRNPRQHALFHLANDRGLSSILSHRARHDVVQRIAGFVDLSVLCSGPVPPNPQELLCRPAFAELLAELSADYEVIILDTPPGDSYADMQTLATRARAAVLAVRQHHTLLDTAQRMTDQLSRLGVRVLGGVYSEF